MLVVSFCNLIPRSLHPQSIIGTPLFLGDAFQWARFCNDLLMLVSERCVNVTSIYDHDFAQLPFLTVYELLTVSHFSIDLD